MIEQGNITKRALTQSQLAIYTGQRLNAEAPLYNMAHSFEIPLALDVEAFHRAFQKTIDGADALRTLFFEDGEAIPYQIVLPGLEFQSDFVDFTSEGDGSHVTNWMAERSRRPFTISEYLFDSVLIKMETGRFIWFLNVHHLITDATASTILYKRTLTQYYGLVTGQVQTIPPLPPYSDYLDFEGVQKGSPQLEETKTYWIERVKTLVATPRLYGKTNKTSDTKSERVLVPLGAERSKKLKAMAQRPEIRAFTQHLTLFNIFSTLLFAYLYRVSGQRRLAIGAPSQNRPSKGFKETPGLFIEVYPLVTEVEGNERFLDLLNRVKIEANNYLRHAQPGMSGMETSKSFNAVLNYITAEFDTIQGIPAKSEWIHPGHCDPAHHLRCHVYDFDSSGEIEVYFDLNETIFNKELRTLAPEHFLKLVDAFLADVNQTITEASLVTEKERQELLPPSKPYETSDDLIIAQFERMVQRNAAETAISFKEQNLSYSELDGKVNKLANYLLKEGVAKRDTVSIHLGRSTHYIISLLAVLKSGAVFVPISSDQPKERIAWILGDSKSRLVLTDSRSEHNLEGIRVKTINLDLESQDIENQIIDFKSRALDRDETAYIIYTSGSTGRPKGAPISHASLAHYLNWAKTEYALKEKFIFPLFTSIGFDLTITSTFLPLITGGKLVIYGESATGPDLSIIQVIEDNQVNSIKLTPSHLTLLQDGDLSHSRLKLMIVGGEDFKTHLARSMRNAIGNDLRIYNEYGPTEATVGCIVGQFDEHLHRDTSVPIGESISNMSAYVLDSSQNLVPKGVVGELFLSGIGLAEGYTDNRLTQERFVENPFTLGEKMYRTGDLARLNENSELEYLGRVDEQVKLSGFRIELAEIESNLMAYPNISNAAVLLVDSEEEHDEKSIINCRECGLPSSYPHIDFDGNDVCHLCVSFKGYKEKTDKYFKTEQDLIDLLYSKKDPGRKYDCLSLLSGGKDSTYVIARLVDMGLNVLAFTLDNGYISDQAKANIKRITQKLGVDHIYGETPHMNKIFVDSLHRHKNVCNGCFKTIYTLSTKVALKNDIPFIVTGLSRGQFFETRLTEELFWNDGADGTTIDDTILEARKLYHQEEDAVKQHLDTSMFNLESTFEKVRYVDFYRYSDVSLKEMLEFLREKADWVRPSDTGRSTNCLINQAGIYVHKKERGYSNYSFPYSWDVRLGHKNRDEALEEINEPIDVNAVERMLDEIGYHKSLESKKGRKQLIGFYAADQKIPSVDLKLHLSKRLPEYMLPVSYKHLEVLPLTKNGKVDKAALGALSDIQLEMETPFVAPGNEIEELLEGIWKEVLQLEKIGIHDNFIGLGGHSLAAIRVTARLNDDLQTHFALNKVFEFPTIAEYAVFIEEQLTLLLQE